MSKPLPIRPLPVRFGAAALAVLLLPAPLLAQKFPGNLPGGGYGAPGYGYVPPQEGGQPYPGGPYPGIGGKFDRAPVPAAPRPRPAPPPAAATPVQADVDADALRLQAEDPPAVVGRVARVTGSAGLRLPGTEDWRPATLNTAIVAGNALWTEPGARAAIEAGTGTLFTDGATALQIDALDEQGLRATLAQGSVFLRLSGLETFGGMADIATPEASVATAIDSRILVETAAPDGSRPGRIAVFEGGAEVTLAGSAEPIRLGPGQAVTLSPGGTAPQVGPAGPPTPLMAWALGAEPRMPLPQAVRGMTGAAELGQIGRWDRSPEYGEIWYPPVQQDWVPYQDGSWEWRDPWGWTWVDAAPWGFVTGHYGRWVRVGPRWGWAPAPVPIIGLPPLRPVWAPALVTFFAPPPRPGWGRPVGWIPLGPREAWYPWYRASPAYVARVNLRQVPYVVPVRQRWTAWGGPERRHWDDWDRNGRWDDRRDDRRWAGPEDRRVDAYRNRAAATLVPERTMLASRPVREEARRADPAVWREAARGAGLPPHPDGETRGLTPRGAERLGLAPGDLRPPRGDRGAEPPPGVRNALPAPSSDRLRPGRGEEAGIGQGRAAADPGAALRQRQREEQARRPADLPSRPADATGGATPRPFGQEPDARAQRREALRQRLQEGQPNPRGDGGARDASRGEADKFGQPRPDPMRRPPDQAGRGPDGAEPFRRQQEQMDQARRQQEQMQRQQMEQGRRQQEDSQRQQMNEARRQQEQMQRQQMEQTQRQQQQQQQMQRQQADQQRQQMNEARRQQEQLQRQQMEQGRRQQEQIQRQQMEQAQRQQQQMQRQQMEQAQRQQEQIRRQQMEQVQRQQEQIRRQQMEQAQRQQEQIQRQQMEQAQRQQQQMQRQQMEQAQRQQQQQVQRQQEQAQRQQQRRDQRQQ